MDGPLDEYEQITSLLKDRPNHKGMDFKTPVGTPVKAPASGTVTRINWNWHANGDCVELKLADGTLAKCDMCIDRVENGLLPACVETCPTGAMNFGERDEILALAKKRLSEARKKFPKAVLIDPDDVRVIYLTAFDPALYYENAMADAGHFDMSRKMALKRMVRPVAGAASRLLRL